MAYDTWGGSWGTSWGTSWTVDSPPPPPTPSLNILPLPPVPNTAIVERNPTADAIWHRWLEQLRNRLTLPGQGLGNVVGPAVSTDGALAAFDGTTGAILENTSVLMGWFDQDVTTTAAPTFDGATLTSLLDISAPTAGQIQFPTPQNPSSDLNTLDDYAELPFLPVLTFETPGDLMVDYIFQVGNSTKIGDRVFVDILISTLTFTHTTASGSLIVTGFPYETTGISYGALNFEGITKAGYTNFVAALLSPNDFAYVVAGGSALPASRVDAADVPSGGNVRIAFSICFTA